MVQNCSDLLNDNTQENPFTDRDFTLAEGAVQPRNSGQRFWYLANQGDNNKFCLYDRDITDNEFQKNSGTFLGPVIKSQTISVTPDLNLPIGVALQVLTPGWYEDHGVSSTEPAQWPQITASAADDETYHWTGEGLHNNFPHLGFSPLNQTDGDTLYGLNTTEANANSFYTTLTRLHPNGHFKYFNDQAKRLYIRATSALNDTVELYLVSDDLFLVGRKPAFMSHAKPDGPLTSKLTSNERFNAVDVSLARTEAIFWWFRFRFTIQPQ